MSKNNYSDELLGGLKMQDLIMEDQKYEIHENVGRENEGPNVRT